jgi:hypothetical protein
LAGYVEDDEAELKGSNKLVEHGLARADVTHNALWRPKMETRADTRESAEIAAERAAAGSLQSKR